MHLVNYGNKVLKNKDLNLADNTTPKKYNVYDYIDDSQIRDIVNPILKSLETAAAKTEDQNSRDSEFDCDDTTTPLNDGYLNPYQPVVFSPDTQGYSEPANSSNCEVHRHQDIPSTVILGIDNTKSQKIESSSYNSYNNAMSAQPNINSYVSMHEQLNGQSSTS
ncbi:unnamed protein product [Mytilus coruscus]|uniref:Uncharacterized protein n=1 Tax=Mytilus coruscus TaxID=42192 RepID=A0A6J8EYT1_MYTCO|nr:unnamed protein product [Mytilus coruscus]